MLSALHVCVRSLSPLSITRPPARLTTTFTYPPHHFPLPLLHSQTLLSPPRISSCSSLSPPNPLLTAPTSKSALCTLNPLKCTELYTTRLCTTCLANLCKPGSLESLASGCIEAGYWYGHVPIRPPSGNGFTPGLPVREPCGMVRKSMSIAVVGLGMAGKEVLVWERLRVERWDVRD